MFTNSEITKDFLLRPYLRIKNPPFPKTWHRIDCVLPDIKSQYEMKQYILDNFEGRFGYYCFYHNNQNVAIIRFEMLDEALFFKLQIGNAWVSEKS